MKKILYTLLVVLFGFSFVGLSAQDMAPEDDASKEPAVMGAFSNSFLKNGIFNLEYNVSLPLGEFKDFVSTPGYRGWNFELKKVLTDNWTVGGSLGWYAFYEHFDRNTYEFESGAITSEVWDYFYSVPIKAVVQYYFMPEAYVQPFIGLSMGVNYNEKERDIGYLFLQTQTWDFTMTPEVGVIIPFGADAFWGAVIKGRYNHIFYNHDNMKAVQFMDFTIGLAYSY